MVALTLRILKKGINMYQLSFQKHNKIPFAYMNHRHLNIVRS